MNQSPNPSFRNLLHENTPIIRDFGSYSLSFPCNPHNLRSTMFGFRLLILSDFMLVVAVLLFFGSLYWLTNYSEQFRTFGESLTPERIELLQQMSFDEKQQLLEKELPIQEIAPYSTIIFLFGVVGIIINLVGMFYCVNCPVIPKAHTYALVWLGAILFASVILWLGPLMCLLAWQYWLSFVSRIALLIGDGTSIHSLRKVHRCLFYALICIVIATLVPHLGGDTTGAYLGLAFFVLVVYYFIAVFFHYSNTLKQIRMNVQQLEQLWDNGNDELIEKNKR